MMRMAPIAPSMHFVCLPLVQLGRRTGFWHYAIEVKAFVKRLARDIVSKLSKRGLESAVE